jgi:uncharacterized protein YhaN
MKLRRIDAVRYGGLEDGSLSGLGDGLTVVLGPNESGKSTFNALTRHVLYGFPRVTKGTRHYKPGADGRAGRLVFAEGDGEWSIERVEGAKGGPVAVNTLAGRERPGLLGELVSGVTEQSFRVVFGFGLDDLAKVGDAEGSEIVDRLYAAGYGLVVNPMDVRKTLEDRAAEGYKPGGSKPTVNLLNAQIRDAKARIRGLETEAQEYAGEQMRARELAEQLEPLKARRDDLDARVRILDRDVQRLGVALETARDLSGQLAILDQKAAELESNREVIDVDEAVIAVEPELMAVLDESSGFRDRIKRMEAAEAAAGDIERRIAIGPALPAEARDSVENRTTVDAWAERLMRLRLAEESADAAAVQATASAAGTASVVQAAAQSQSEAGGRALPIAFAIVGLAVGAVFAVAGLLLSPPQWLAVFLGGVVAILGGVGLVMALLRRPTAAGPPALSADAARLQSDAEAARVVAKDAAEKYQSAAEEWRVWLAEHHLDEHGTDPSAVRQLLDQLRDRGASLGEVARLRAEASRERDAAEAWVVRLVDLVRGFDATAAQIPPLSSALELAARARKALEGAVAARDERAVIARDLAANAATRSGVAERALLADEAIAQVVAGHELDPTDPQPMLEALAKSTALKREQAAGASETLAREHAALCGKLDDDGRDDRMARVRQELEGLEAQAAIAADSYVVDQLAVRLLDLARERFDRERQPEVVRTAGRVFSAMTRGRFTGVQIPFGGQEISVVTAGGALQPAIELSQGTAEQLYLALRVGLISSLGKLGADLPVLMDDIAANYDAMRLAEATAAIAELSAVRQVVFFTCHEATADVLMSAIPGSTLVSLGQCAPR